MASHKELYFDWSMLSCKDYHNWNESDLQLAAELGKTLLERNKELELGLKQHQNIIEDQAQEIEYLTKQTVALREVNDSRLRCYEQLEVSISDLERANHRLNVDNAADKKQIKSLCQNVENLESKCDELTRDLEEVTRHLDQERRRNERIQQQREKCAEKENVRLRQVAMSPDDSSQSGGDTNRVQSHTTNQHSAADTKSVDVTDSSNNVDPLTNPEEVNEELLKLVAALEDAKKMYMNEKERSAELEEELKCISNENRALQTRLHVNANDEMKSIHEELSILEEVRQGQTCSRCLRHADDVQMMQSEDVSVIGTEDDDDRSLISLLNSTETQNMYHSEVTFKGIYELCANSTTKKLHDLLPVQLLNLVLELWMQFRKFSFFRWIIKLIQWPAYILYRMISIPSIPYDNFNFL